MMQQPALIVMAAGMGSRYGGLKQVEPIGPSGEMIVDYAVFDALRAGFGKIVFVIREEIEDIFRERVGKQIEQHAETAYVFQDLNNVPPHFAVPAGRTKPWGTGHAVLACKYVVSEPCAVINADDFYGPQAFAVLARHLREANDTDQTYDYSMVGYRLGNALSEYGSVARGVCEVTADGKLTGVVERTRIEKQGSAIRYTEDGSTWIDLPASTIVSMNMWGFTPSIFTELEDRFPHFLQRSAANILKAEFFLPTVVNALLEEGKAQVEVLPTQEKWFGITNPDDLPVVQAAIREMVQVGTYPQRLWDL
jgi:UTP-glucose-1-phosphate uridylyltransferase